MNPENEASAGRQLVIDENPTQSGSEKSIGVHMLVPDEFHFKSKLEMTQQHAQTGGALGSHNEITSQLQDNQQNADNARLQEYKPQDNLLLTNLLGAPLKKSDAPPDVKETLLRKYYSIKPGMFEHAVEDIKRYLKPTIDGNFLSAWLLAEIDHWDHEKERLVILTDTLLVLVKYNFVASRIEECKRIQLHRIDRIQGGRFQYPEKTMMMPRVYQTGIRLSWNKNEVLTKWQRFSPFFNSPSYVTFTQHKAVFYMDEIPSHMIYEYFKTAVINAVQNAGAIFEVVLEPIFIEVYIGAMSVIHNSSDLGYSKDRGAASF